MSNRAFGFFIAFLSTTVALAVRLALGPLLGPDARLLLFGFSVQVTAAVGGFIPGLLATALSLLAGVYFIFEPLGRFGLDHEVDVIYTTIFLIMGIAISAANEALHRARRNAEEKQLELAEEILERQRAERDRAELLNRLETLITNAPVGISLFDTELRYVQLNDTAIILDDMPRQEHLGKMMSEIVPAVGRQIEPTLDRVLKSGKPVTGVEFSATIPGRSPRRSWYASYYPVRGFDGKVHGVGAIALDITERKKLENEYHRASERLRHLIDNTPLAVIEWNREFVITGWSGEAARIFGWSREEIVGKTMAESGLVYPEEDEKVARVREMLSSGASRYVVSPNRNLTKDGRIVHCEWYNSITRGPDGQMESLLSLVLDVTERNLAEMALKDADRKKDEFLATLAHELRNPLAPIRNALELLKLGGPGDRQMQSAREMIDRQVQQMVRLVDDLLDVSRITAGKLQLRRQKVVLHEAVQNAVEMVQPLINSFSHELVIDLPPEPLLVEGDFTRLSQIFGNLLNNAAKYTSRAGHISISGERQGSDVVVMVTDDGIGIPEHMLTRIFDMFAQVDRSLERSQGGLGIGLTLVKLLVEMHGGHVEARNRGSEKGSQFIVRLPISLETQERVTETPSRHRTRQSSRILVVDDNVDAAESLSMLLRLKNDDVRTAHDGLEAVQVAETFRPELVLLDIGLPKMNGYEVARHIRGQAWGEKTFLIALTGWGQEDDKRKAREAGFNFHMVKPVDPASLEKLLSGYLGSTS